MNPAIKTKILVIDDEVSVCKFLKHTLEANDFEVFEANNGSTGLQKIIENRPELVILDHGMPEMNGLEVLKQMREWSKIPVIFLTVRDSDEDKVAVLDAGANDYLTKPFSVKELLARIRVALRHGNDVDASPIFIINELTVDRTARMVKAGNVEIKLTSTEYSLLNLLIKYAGKVVLHRIILKEIWGPHSTEHNHYLRVYFGQIRKKLNQAAPGLGNIIECESGVGYRLKI